MPPDAARLIIILFAFFAAVLVVVMLIALRLSKARKAALLQDALRSGERIIIEPDICVYSCGKPKSPLRYSGDLMLTAGGLIFRKHIGSDIRIGLEKIQAASERAWHQGSFRLGWKWLVLKLDDGSEAAFHLKNASRWLREINHLKSEY